MSQKAKVDEAAGMSVQIIDQVEATGHQDHPDHQWEATLEGPLNRLLEEEVEAVLATVHPDHRVHWEAIQVVLLNPLLQAEVREVLLAMVALSAVVVVAVDLLVDPALKDTKYKRVSK